MSNKPTQDVSKQGFCLEKKRLTLGHSEKPRFWTLSNTVIKNNRIGKLVGAHYFCSYVNLVSLNSAEVCCKQIRFKQSSIIFSSKSWHFMYFWIWLRKLDSRLTTTHIHAFEFWWHLPCLSNSGWIFSLASFATCDGFLRFTWSGTCQHGKHTKFPTYFFKQR